MSGFYVSGLVLVRFHWNECVKMKWKKKNQTGRTNCNFPYLKGKCNYLNRLLRCCYIVLTYFDRVHLIFTLFFLYDRKYQTIKLDNCLEIHEHAIRKTFDFLGFFFLVRWVQVFYVKFKLIAFRLEVVNVFFSVGSKTIIRTVQVRTNAIH